MRALSPKDAIEAVEESPVPIPAPKYPVGQLVRRDSITPYHRKLILRALLRDTRKIVDKLRRGGYIEGAPKTRLPSFNKAKVREEMALVDTADRIEICGFAPWAMHVCGAIANECYLVNGQCHSGLSWQYFLLFRKETEGRKLVFVHKHPLVLESSIKVD